MDLTSPMSTAPVRSVALCAPSPNAKVGATYGLLRSTARRGPWASVSAPVRPGLRVRSGGAERRPAAVLCGIAHLLPDREEARAVELRAQFRALHGAAPRRRRRRCGAAGRAARRADRRPSSRRTEGQRRRRHVLAGARRRRPALRDPGGPRRAGPGRRAPPRCSNAGRGRWTRPTNARSSGRSSGTGRKPSTCAAGATTPSRRSGAR